MADVAPSITLPVKQEDTTNAPQDEDPSSKLKSEVDADDKPLENASTSLSPLGPFPRLGTKRCSLARPSFQDDLIAMFDLGPLAATVARVDTVTGAKINKMRKSYEGQLKTLGLAGRNKASKHEDGGLGLSLENLCAWPEEEWMNQVVFGKEMARGFSKETLANLSLAFSFDGPQTISKQRMDEWENILGLERKRGPAQIPVAAQARPGKTAAQEQLGRRASIGNNAEDPGSPGSVDRPRRMAKKRSYHEDAFEGYGEGYVDDNEDGGNSSDEGSRRGTVRKKSRKDRATPVSTPGATAR